MTVQLAARYKEQIGRSHKPLNNSLVKEVSLDYYKNLQALCCRTALHDVWALFPQMRCQKLLDSIVIVTTG